MNDTQYHLDRTIAYLQSTAENGYAISAHKYKSVAKSHGLYTLNYFLARGIRYSEICRMAGLKNRRPGGRHQRRRKNPNEEALDQPVERLPRIRLDDFPLQAIPTRTETVYRQVNGVTYRIVREYASVR